MRLVQQLEPHGMQVVNRLHEAASVHSSQCACTRHVR